MISGSCLREQFANLEMSAHLDTVRQSAGIFSMAKPCLEPSLAEQASRHPRKPLPFYPPHFLCSVHLPSRPVCVLTHKHISAPQERARNVAPALPAPYKLNRNLSAISTRRVANVLVASILPFAQTQGDITRPCIRPASRAKCRAVRHQ